MPCSLPAQAGQDRGADGSVPAHSPHRRCCCSSRRVQAHCEAQHSFPGVQTVSLATAATAEAAATGIAAKQTASRTRGLDRPSQETCRALGSQGAPVACHLPPTLLPAFPYGGWLWAALPSHSLLLHAARQRERIRLLGKTLLLPVIRTQLQRGQEEMRRS